MPVSEGDDVVSSIVKCTRKGGSVFAYESTAKWDPVAKQSRPVRRYLGRVDPVTGEVIPSSGKRGRPKGSKNRVQVIPDSGEYDGSSAGNGSSISPDQAEELQELQERVRSMQLELNRLSKRNAYLESVLSHIRDQVTKAIPT